MSANQGLSRAFGTGGGYALVNQNVMKLEVSILGGQIIDQKRKKGCWRRRRERIEKGSRDSLAPVRLSESESGALQ